MKTRMQAFAMAAVLTLGATSVWAKIPPPPPPDEKAKAAAEEKKQRRTRHYIGTSASIYLNGEAR